MLTLLVHAEIPSWVLNPPADDNNHFYGVGEGDSMRMARDEALNTIAAKLSTSVASTLSKNATQSTLGSGLIFNSTTNQQLSSEVKKITFSNYNIVYNAVENGRTYVLVKVNRNQFLAEKKEEIADLEKEMANLFSKLKSKEILERFKILKDITQTAERAKTLVSIVASLDPSYQKEPHLNQYVLYKLKLDDLLDEIEIYVAADNESRYFADVVREEFAKEKIKTSKVARRDNPNGVIVEVEARPTVREIYGRYIAKAQVILSLKKRDGSIVVQNSIEAKGSSSIDADNAIIAASKDFAEILSQKGLLMLLGLKD